MARSVAPVLPITMVAIDIDGTLVGDDLVIRERTAAAIAAAVRRGLHVSLATGRMVTSAEPIARTLGLQDPVIGAQGGIVRAMPSQAARRAGHLGRLLYHRPLEAADARAAIAWCVERGLDPHVNHLETFIIRADDPRVDDYSAFLGGSAKLVPDLISAIERPVTKVIASGAPPRPMQLLPAAREAFAGRASVTVSHPSYLEFVAEGVSKGRAIRWLAARHGVELGQVLAIGDQLNDLEMICAVGHGTAMPHAPAAVLAAARYVASPLAAQGVAELLERLVLAPRANARAASEALAAAAAEARPAA
ncbi:MAG: Cof-type HAD-IIB family hydrolase [Chloroflexi bacterium]|nr:Cof-type HAD-IIB family hydrolase [Chloroflexota bacterium]